MTERYLTEGEKNLARQVFGNELNTDSIKIIRESYLPFKLQDNRNLMAPNGNIYMTPENRSYREDYSAASVSPYTKSLFIHEITHVWQHQRGVNVLVRGAFEQAGGILYENSGKMIGSDPYVYPEVSTIKNFNSLGIEQQAALIQDFYLVKFHGQKSKLGDLESYKKLIYATQECFLFGTKIKVVNSSVKSIENLVVGDTVLAFNPKHAYGAELSSRKITKLFRNVAKTIVGLCGLHCTPGHVFLTGEIDSTGHSRFATITSILHNDGTIVEQDATVIRARTGAKLGQADDALVSVIYRDPPRADQPGQERRALVRAGIPLPPVMIKDNIAPAQSLAQHLADHGITPLADGRLHTPDGTIHDACNWPEGTTPFDTHEARNWIVQSDGVPYCPPWIRDLVAEDETEGLRVVAALSA